MNINPPSIIISIHALLAESDGPLILRLKELKYFYPRSPCGERRTRSQPSRPRRLFLSTLSLRRATFGFSAGRESDTISIHALLAESDINSRFLFRLLLKFLSTLSLRRATPTCEYQPTKYYYFYPRSPCGERRYSACCVVLLSRISIHALLAESDLLKNHIFFHHNLFLSTLSLRRATPRGQSASIQASYFYPRSPCGERL